MYLHLVNLQSNMQVKTCQYITGAMLSMKLNKLFADIQDTPGRLVFENLAIVQREDDHSTSQSEPAKPQTDEMEAKNKGKEKKVKKNKGSKRRKMERKARQEAEKKAASHMEDEVPSAMIHENPADDDAQVLKGTSDGAKDMDNARRRQSLNIGLPGGVNESSEALHVMEVMNDNQSLGDDATIQQSGISSDVLEIVQEIVRKIVQQGGDVAREEAVSTEQMTGITNETDLIKDTHTTLCSQAPSQGLDEKEENQILDYKSDDPEEADEGDEKASSYGLSDHLQNSTPGDKSDVSEEADVCDALAFAEVDDDPTREANINGDKPDMNSEAVEPGNTHINDVCHTPQYINNPGAPDPVAPKSAVDISQEALQQPGIQIKFMGKLPPVEPVMPLWPVAPKTKEKAVGTALDAPRRTDVGEEKAFSKMEGVVPYGSHEDGLKIEIAGDNNQEVPHPIAPENTPLQDSSSVGSSSECEYASDSEESVVFIIPVSRKLTFPTSRKPERKPEPAGDLFVLNKRQQEKEPESERETKPERVAKAKSCASSPDGAFGNSFLSPTEKRTIKSRFARSRSFAHRVSLSRTKEVKEAERTRGERVLEAYNKFPVAAGQEVPNLQGKPAPTKIPLGPRHVWPPVGVPSLGVPPVGIPPLGVPPLGVPPLGVPLLGIPPPGILPGTLPPGNLPPGYGLPGYDPPGHGPHGYGPHGYGPYGYGPYNYGPSGCLPPPFPNVGTQQPIFQPPPVAPPNIGLYPTQQPMKYPRIAPPVQRFVDMHNANSLQHGDVPKLLADYQRLAGVLRQRGVFRQ